MRDRISVWIDLIVTSVEVTRDLWNGQLGEIMRELIRGDKILALKI